MSQFNAQSTTADVIRGISLAGKVAVVTGASAGLGVETSRTLASAGARVLLLARDAAKLETVVSSIGEDNPGAQLDTASIDLADLDSVRHGAADILRRYPVIDLMVNNAGVMACPLARTRQGFEMQFGTNHLGHFLLTCLLTPALQAAAEKEPGGARVVSLSSAGHKLGDVDLEDPNYLVREYDKWEAYGQSKTANALFAVGLDKRLGESGVHALAVHPGSIMTELGRHLLREDYEMLMARAPANQPMQFKSVEQGSATSVWAATAAELEGRGGLYLEDCGIAGPAAPGGDGGVESYALDRAAADRLWTLSEALVGQAFSF